MKSKHARIALAAALLVLVPLSARAGARYKVLHSFGNGEDGATPYGPLILRRGNLYGVTIAGGSGCGDGGCGTVFELSALANRKWKEAALYSFPGGDYSYPSGALALGPPGNIYGTVGGYQGGVFQLSPASGGGWTLDMLYTDGAGPGLLMDDLGNLYGQMFPGQYKAGAIGELSPGADGWTYAQFYSFCSGNGCPDGDGPSTQPTWDGKGNMFGTTTFGGIYSQYCLPYYTLGCGVIYEMTPNGDGTWTYTVLHRFLESSKADGRNPYSGLVVDKAGNFYGGTWAGGRYDLGTVFKLEYTGGRWQETILYNFTNCTHGCGVDGTLAMDSAGNLYGTAAGGPPSGCGGLTCGVVFKLSPQKNGKWKYSVVYNLTEEGGGAAPFYGVIVDDKGNLFGVTSHFGKYNFGTAFEITQ